MDINDIMGGLARVNDPDVTALPEDGFPALPVPDLAVPLMPFQREGVERILSHPDRRVLLADQMGLGKTPQLLCVALAAVRADLGPVAVVVPPSLRLNWEREAHRFTPDLEVAVLVGTEATCLPDADLYVVGDSTSITAWEPLLSGHVRTLLVDECHRVKSPKTRRATAVRTIAQTIPAEGFVVLASGTPMLNHPAELCSPLNILSGSGKTTGIYRIASGGPGHFLNRYAPVVNRWGGRGVNHDMLPDLHVRLHDALMVRRLRDDVIDLPGKGRTTVTLPMSKAGEKRYSLAEEDLRQYLANDGHDAKRIDRSMRAEALVQLNALRREAGRALVPAVVDYVRTLVEQDERVLVATWHRDVSNKIAEALGAAKIIGGMSDLAKEDAVRRFTSDDEDSVDVLVGNVESAGVGYTLHGEGRCASLVMSELPYGPAQVLQMEDRLCRIGMPRFVQSHIVISGHSDQRPTVSEHLWNLLLAKADIIGEVMDGDDADRLHADESIINDLLAIYGE
jgi:SNF2 family DNA or RNA helicase